MVRLRHGAARPGLGRGYRRLWTAAAVSTFGDGVTATALPLLAASLTTDPFTLSLVSFGIGLPWLVFGLVSGALVDRWDRRATMWTVDAFRGVLVGVLAVAVLTGWASIALLAAVGFALGVAQTLFDNAVQPFIPALVGRDSDRLQRANSQLYGSQTLTEGFLGPPTGGSLFSAAAAAPFLLDAVSFVASAGLIASIRGTFVAEGSRGPRRSLRADIAEGLRWLFAHRLLRALALIVGTMNLATTAGGAIRVLYAREEFHLGNVGYGLLLTGMAVGGVLGSLVASRISRRVGVGTLLVGGTVVIAAATLGFGLVSNAWAGGVLLAFTSLASMVFNVVGVSLRQSLIPDPLMGRVVSAYRVIGYGAIPLGALVGGSVARGFGLRAPFVLGAVLLVAAAVAVWPVANNQAIQAARDAADWEQTANGSMAEPGEPVAPGDPAGRAGPSADDGPRTSPAG